MFGGRAVGLRIAVIAAALGCGIFCALGTSPARAQHIVTDMEAGKLTLDALTATPRPIYRQIMDYRRVHHSGYAPRSVHAHLIAYRRRTGLRSIHH